MSKTIKNVLIIGGVILAIVIAYMFFSSNQTPDSNLVQVPVAGLPLGASDSSEATAFLSTLLNLNQIKIDTSIFTTPTFAKLKDNTVPIVNDGAVGRMNPFAQVIDNTPATENSMNFPQINNGVGTKNTAPTN